MKTVGILGGIGPESTVEYYQYIIAAPKFTSTKLSPNYFPEIIDRRGP
jgi:aspartate/glutamate racemase